MNTAQRTQQQFLVLQKVKLQVFQLGLTVYHVCEPEMKAEFDEAVYDEQVSMMEMVLDVDDIVSEMSAIRDEYCKYL